MVAIARFGTISALILVLSGCGGGGEDLASRPRIRVHWPAIGRATEVSSYANSVRITLPNARLNPITVNGALQTDVVIEANRPSDSENEATYTISDPIKTGQSTMIFETFSQLNQLGRQLQAKTESVSVLADGYFPDIQLSPGSESAQGIDLALIGSYSPPYNEGDPIFSSYVGESPLIAPVVTGIPGIESKYENDIHWILEYSDNPQGDVIEGVPIKKPNSSYFSVKTVRPGLVTVRASIDGIISNPAVFRIVARP